MVARSLVHGVMIVVFLLAAVGLLPGCVTMGPPERAFIIAPEPYLSAGQALLARGVIDIRYLAPEALGCVSGMSCAALYADGHCMIKIRSDYSADYSHRVIYEHEAAHCAGWPSDHPGGHA